MSTTVVCIARTLAAGGEDIARGLADRLGFRVVDAEIVRRAAEAAGVDPARLAAAEQRQPLMQRILLALRPRGGSADGDIQREAALAAAAASGGKVTEDRLRACLRSAIEEVAAEGRAVIVAHAASLALAGRAGVLRVLVTGSPEMRVQRLVGLSGASRSEARAAVGASDEARADYLRRFHGVAAELPTHYDVVVNTDQLPPERAVEMLLAAAG